MPAKRLSMRKIRDVIRLKFGCRMSERQIACRLGLARSTVADYLTRVRQAGLSWPQSCASTVRPHGAAAHL